MLTVLLALKYSKNSVAKTCAHSILCRRSTYNHLSSWLTDARNLTNPNTVSWTLLSLKSRLIISKRELEGLCQSIWSGHSVL